MFRLNKIIQLTKQNACIILCVYSLVFFALPVLGQREALRLKYFGLEQGLSQSAGICILQDRFGFIWVGTQDGLNKYDGYTFKIYRNEVGNHKSIAGNSIKALCEDSDGIIWVGTQDTGLSAYDPKLNSFKTYIHNPNDPKSISDNNIEVLYIDRDGNLWIGTQNGGLCLYDKNSDSFTSFIYNPSDLNSLSNNNILAIYEDHLANLLIGTKGGGLCCLDRKSNKFTNYRQSVANENGYISSNVQSICEDKKGRLFVGTVDGLYRYDATKNVFIYYKNISDNSLSLVKNNVSCLLKDNTGTLWIGTLSGLCKYDYETDTFISIVHDFKQSDSLTTSYIRSLYEDRQGLIWIGVGGEGVYCYDKLFNYFSTYKKEPLNPNSLSSNIVYALAEDLTGNLWIGTHDGLCFYNKRKRKFSVFKYNPNYPKGLSGNSIIALAVDLEGNVWIGTGSDGLCSYDVKTGKFKQYKHDLKNPKSICSNNIIALYVDSLGILWIGTRNNGLCKYDKFSNSFITYNHDSQDPESISVNEIRSICEGTNGVLWIGTKGGGLCKFNRYAEKFTTYRNDSNNSNSLSNNTVWAIYQDKTGILWLGTHAGLNRFDPQKETFQVLRTAQGLANDFVIGILEDKNNNLWISTNGGISRYNLITNTFRNFDVSDGLQSNEFCSGACLKTKNGYMYFGGVEGFNEFMPENISQNTYIPPIVITELKKFNKPVQLKTSITVTKEIIVNYWENFITLEFAALNFSKSQKNQYAYKLEGFDKEWIQAGIQRSATYTNLDGGTYVFRVKGSNNDGVWNEEGASIKVIVIPPPWKQWWAYIFYFVLFGGGIGGAFRFQVNRIRGKARLKEIQLRAESAEIQAMLAKAKAETEAHAAELQAKAAAELAERNTKLDSMVLELQKKNNELIESQRQADRIFSALAEALPGTVLDGKYKLEEKIGTGGFGAVFKGIHLGLNKAIAIKVFRPSSGNDSASSIERFKLEGISASRINHPNAISVIDSGISKEGIAYLVMELLEGHTLAEEIVGGKKLTVERCKEIIVPICEALAEAHRLGIIHRDIKPGNIFLHKEKDSKEIVKVVDFGVAKMVSEETGEEFKNLTVTGGLIGTPTYMAPERIRELEYDGRSDVYSVGVMLYEMLCGKTPFVAGDRGIAGIVMGHLTEKVPSMKVFNADVSTEVEKIVKMALIKDPNKRPTAKEFADTFSKA